MSQTQLEKDFDAAMRDVYENAKKLGYVATRYYQMLCKHGGFETACILLASNAPAEGFTELWKRGHLDISVEAIVLQDKWKSLFTPEQLAVAHRRLDDLDYFK